MGYRCTATAVHQFETSYFWQHFQIEIILFIITRATCQFSNSPWRISTKLSSRSEHLSRPFRQKLISIPLNKAIIYSKHSFKMLIQHLGPSIVRIYHFIEHHFAN